MAEDWWEPYAWTDRQRKIMTLRESGASGSEIARALGVSCHRSVLRDIRTIKTRAAEKAQGPQYLQRIPVADSEIVKGTSTLYGADGAPKLQWVKTRADDTQRQEMIRAIVDELKEDLPRAPPSPPPDRTNADLVNAYVLSDYHLGMLAWREESGNDWDLSIAESLLSRWIDEAISQSPNAETGIFLQLGDYLHFDSLQPITPTSGHLLDADTRFSKLVRIMVRVTKGVIEKLKKKHERVLVLMAEGNHDMASSVMMREFLSALYELEPRIEVDTSPRPYYAHVFGDVMIAAHHGHLKKNDELPLSLATMFPEQWGQTRYRYAHTGHRHHREIKEHLGIVVEQHPTLAAKDAYTSRRGYSAQRAAHAITYHVRHGEVGRVTLGPEAVL